MQKEPIRSDEWRRAPAKKNTKRWCRGKVGVEHTPEVVLNRWGYRPERCCAAPDWMTQLWRSPWRCFHQRRCTTCGKILDYFLDWKDCPELPAALRK